MILVRIGTIHAEEDPPHDGVTLPYVTGKCKRHCISKCKEEESPEKSPVNDSQHESTENTKVHEEQNTSLKERQSENSEGDGKKKMRRKPTNIKIWKRTLKSLQRTTP